MSDDGLNPTAAIATAVVEGCFENLSNEMVAAVKTSMLDSLGVAMAGAVEPLGKTITAFVRDLGGAPSATVLGSSLRTSAPNAALANGAMIHALDYDDSLQIFSYHFSSFLLPTVLALGESTGISGKQAITAFAYGLETSAAVFRAATSRRDYDIGWHRTCTVGTLASAATAAKVLNLDVQQTRMALGMAASQSCGLRENFGTMTKPLHSGIAARNGITAAMLAQRGFTADANVLEGQLGFFKVFYGDGHYDAANVAASLAHPFSYASSMRIKKYPCCGQTARPIDAMLGLVQRYDIRPEQVERIECGINPSVMNILVYDHPATGLEGKFSLEFCLAVALLDRKVLLGDFTDARVHDARVQAMMRKVSKYPDPAVPHHGGKGPTVTVHMKDGSRHALAIDMEEDQPWPLPTEQETLDKYRDCARRVLDDDKIEKCLELMGRLEQVADIREVIAAVSV